MGPSLLQLHRSQILILLAGVLVFVPWFPFGRSSPFPLVGIWGNVTVDACCLLGLVAGHMILTLLEGLGALPHRFVLVEENVAVWVEVAFAGPVVNGQIPAAVLVTWALACASCASNHGPPWPS